VPLHGRQAPTCRIDQILCSGSSRYRASGHDGHTLVSSRQRPPTARRAEYIIPGFLHDTDLVATEADLWLSDWVLNNRRREPNDERSGGGPNGGMYNILFSMSTVPQRGDT
jgi:hypothetical protein